MTKSICEGDQAALARKAVRARALIDPLGAKGFRRPSERIRKEANARRLAFFAALAAFAGTFGAIIATAPDTVPFSTFALSNRSQRRQRTSRPGRETRRPSNSDPHRSA